MEWDKFSIAQRFLQKANAIHPEEMQDSKRHDEALAIQDVYYDCYMSSFSREELIKRLREIASGVLEMPEEEVDHERYRNAYIKHAKTILSSIERGEFS